MTASAKGVVARWATWGPQVQSVLRVVAAFMFMQAGTMKLLAWPIGMPPDGGTAHVMTEVWIGGMLEIVGGGLLLLELLTRPVAFLLSGEMAVAYFQFHFPHGLWPV
jgi:putative oxidoreductase